MTRGLLVVEGVREPTALNATVEGAGSSAESEGQSTSPTLAHSKRSGCHAVIFPVKALAITVSGLAKYSFPGPERP